MPSLSHRPWDALPFSPPLGFLYNQFIAKWGKNGVMRKLFWVRFFLILSYVTLLSLTACPWLLPASSP